MVVSITHLCHKCVQISQRESAMSV